MSSMSDDELLGRLTSALAPESITPDARSLEQFRDALQRSAKNDDVIVSISSPTKRRASRLHRLRHPVGAAIGVIFLASTSVAAAAAVGTDTLPGPTRTVAYEIGLPVTSPALYQTQETLHQLNVAVDHHDPVAAREAGNQLRRNLQQLNPRDLTHVQGPARALLPRAGVPVPPSITIPPRPTPPTTPQRLPEQQVPAGTSPVTSLTPSPPNTQPSGSSPQRGSTPALHPSSTPSTATTSRPASGRPGA